MTVFESAEFWKAVAGLLALISSGLGLYLKQKGKQRTAAAREFKALQANIERLIERAAKAEAENKLYRNLLKKQKR